MFTSRTSVTVFVCKRTKFSGIPFLRRLFPFVDSLLACSPFIRSVLLNCMSHGNGSMGAISSGFCNRGLVSLG